MLDIVIARALQFATVFLAFRVMLSALPPEEVGRLNVFMTVASGVILLAISPFGQYLHRSSMEWKESGKMPERLAAFASLVLMMTLVSVALVGLIADLTSLSTVSLGFLGLYVFGSSLSQSLIGAIGIIASVKLSIWLQISLTAVATLAGFLACELAVSSAEFWVVGLATVNFAAALLLMKSMMKGSATFPTLTEIKEMLVESGRFVSASSVTTGFFWVVFQGPRLYLAEVMPAGAFGLFATAIMLAAFMVAAVDAFLASFTGVAVYRSFLGSEEGYKSAFQRHMDWTIVAVLGVWSVGLVAGHTALIIIAPEAHQGATAFWLACLTWESLRLFAGTTVVAAVAARKPGMCVLPLVCTALVMVFLKFLLSIEVASMINFGVPMSFVMYIALFCLTNRVYRVTFSEVASRRFKDGVLAAVCIGFGIYITSSPILGTSILVLVASSLLLVGVWLSRAMHIFATN